MPYRPRGTLFLMKIKHGQNKSVVWKEGSQYVAQSLNVDVSSFGSTRREALQNLREALELFFEDQTTPLYSDVRRPELVTF